MADRDDMPADAHARLEQAQSVYKRFYDKHHRDVRFAVGDWVWLRLRHRAPASARRRQPRPRFYGPYRIAEVINEVAYRPELPPRARLHDVFHVGLLNRFVGSPPSAPPALPSVHHGATRPVPNKSPVLDWPEAFAKCLFTGRVNLPHQPHGRTSTASSSATPPSSLRTSCSSRGGEM
ncbi:LOW QUALITY PROTEIN: hypothetical protein U9M48_029376 [Paspalum notatum var. saurae]|uniref:Tf2-1-like SH3-like domain-containing protein n=1 Tax=Paspalum notatum var. saurae TaxID=547442 RepID=A0AAQ3TZC8_PASNO